MCGGCATDQVCTAQNACAWTCDPACPAGYTCGTQATCEASQATPLVLNVQSVTVSGTVTLNGGPLTPQPGCAAGEYEDANVTFVETTYGYSFTFHTDCTAQGAFTGTLFPGTYKVSVANYDSNLPDGSQVVEGALNLSTSQSGLVLNVQSVTVSGTVTLNGGPLTPQPGCAAGEYEDANVTFVETTYGYSFTFHTDCTAQGAFTGTLFPGTYKVSVANYDSNLPDGSQIVISRVRLP
jgi:hypothetical protein